MTDETEKKFRQLVWQLGRMIRAEADKKVGRSTAQGQTQASDEGTGESHHKWVSAFLDVRWYADAEGWKAKLRAILPDGRSFSLRTTDDMDSLALKLSSMRKEASPAEWYGLKVIVNYDGEVTSEVSDDPDCAVDPKWWKS